MEISRKDIKCKEITDKVERLTSSIRRFIQLANQKLPQNAKLNKETFVITQKSEYAFLDDGNTHCDGFAYNIFWCYTNVKQEVNKENVINLTQQNAVTFTLECKERCYDHSMSKTSIFFLLFFKADGSDRAERIDYINNNYDENALFKPYEIMQVVWRVRNALGLNPNYISENAKSFEEFAENFKEEPITFETKESYIKLKNELTKGIEGKMQKFIEQINRFAILVNFYFTFSSKILTLEDIKNFLALNAETEEVIGLKSKESFSKFYYIVEKFLCKPFLTAKEYEYFPKAFLMLEDAHDTFHDNEQENSFFLADCIKCTIGYSYFNDSIFLKSGIEKNWYPRLLYFSYYISKNSKEEYYTISLTSCEGSFRKNYMKVIEATDLNKLLTTENAIRIAKWLEEICAKTELINYYSAQINQKKVKNFTPSHEIN